MSVAAELANCQQRLKEMEARVRWLEGTVSSLLQDRRRLKDEAEPAVAPSLEDDLLALAAGGEPVRTERMTPVAAAPLTATGRRKRSGASTPPATPPGGPKSEPAGAKPAFSGEDLGFTDSFATLEDRLREQLDLETRAKPVNDEPLPVMIDASLIDAAFAKPPPELIHVVSDVEEQFPKILDRILKTWGTPECLGFLRKLIVDERGDRQGFPFDVMSELLVLSSMAEMPKMIRAWEEEAAIAKKAANPVA